MTEAPSGFVITDIEMEGFMRYRDPAKVSLHSSFTAITGPTGSGKSSILDAITFALYGDSSRTDERMKVEDFVEKNGLVRLGFYQGGHKFEVVRGRRAGRSYLVLNQNLKSIRGTTTEIQREIVNIVGLDYIGFRNSTFIRQDEMKAIGSETGAQRLDIFQRLFRLEVFEKAQKLADERLREARNVAIQASAKMEQMLISYEKDLPLKRNELEIAEASAKELMKGADNLKRKEALTRTEVVRIQPLHDAYAKITEGIATLNLNIDETERKIGEAERKNKQRTELSLEIERLKKAVDESYRLSREESRLERIEEKASSIEEKIEIHLDNVTRINDSFGNMAKRHLARLEDYNKRLRSMKTSPDRDEAFDLLRLEGALKERRQRIEQELVWLKEKRQVLEQLNEEKIQVSRQLPVVSKKTKSITGDVFLKTEIKSSIRRLDDDLAKARTKATNQVLDERKKITKLEREKGTLAFTPKMKNKLSQVQARLQEIESDAEAYDKKRGRLEKLPDQRALIREFRGSLTRMKDELGKFSRQEQKLRKHEKDYNTLVDELEGLQRNINEALRKAGEAQGRYKELKQRVSELQELKPEIEKLKSSTTELVISQEIYTVLKEEIFHRKGVLIYAINQLLQGIGRESSFILGELTDKRLNNLRLTPYADTRGGGVRIEVEGVDGLFHDVSVFSGGEKTQVNAALRFAIAKELASMPQIGKSYGNMKTLFIDEGDLGSLDTEQSRRLFIRKLFTLGDLFVKVILITHITEVADQFPARIRVYMTPEQFSRIAEVTANE